jgi:hypothetical protein
MGRAWWLVVSGAIACTPAPKMAPRAGDLYRTANGRCQVRVEWPRGWAPLPCASDGPCEDDGIPADVDCPEELLDPHEVSTAPARPEGRERWLRVKPVLVLLGDQMCTFEPDRYCAPPDEPFACAPPPEPVAVECAALDGSRTIKPTRWAVSSFRYKDAAGKCRIAAARECTQAQCEHIEGEAAACP